MAMSTKVGRRAFVEAMLFLPCGAVLVRCGASNMPSNSDVPSGMPKHEPPAAAPTVSGSQTVYTSSEDSAHFHTFAIPLDDLAASRPEGISGETSENDGHTHAVSVSMKDLEDVQAGQSVMVTTSVDSGHAHVFTFLKAAETPS